MLSLTFWSFCEAEDEEWYNKQHGTEGIAYLCTVVPVHCRGNTQLIITLQIKYIKQH